MATEPTQYFVYTKNIKTLVKKYIRSNTSCEEILYQLLWDIDAAQHSVSSSPDHIKRRPGAKMVALPVILEIVRAAKKPIPAKVVVSLAAAQQISRAAAYASIKAAVSSGLLTSEHGFLRQNIP